MPTLQIKALPQSDHGRVEQAMDVAAEAIAATYGGVIRR